MASIACYVCNTESIKVGQNLDGTRIECPRCGTYEITSSLIASSDCWQTVKLHMLSYYIRFQNEQNTVPRLDNYNIKNHVNSSEIPLEKKADLLLRGFAKDAKTYTDIIDIKNPKYIAVIAAKDIWEYDFVFSMLYTAGLIYGLKREILGKQPLLYVDCTITSEGWIRIESLNKQTDSKQGFVAMWFSDEMQSVYDKGIKPAIEMQLNTQNESTDQPTRLKALKINDKLHNGKIDDEIIAEIQRSRFVVADFTGHRGGVYFEAGYALGLGIPVIWTCRKDHFDNKEDDKYVHFDIRQYNFRGCTRLSGMILYVHEDNTL